MFDFNLIGTFLILLGLELVLGIDNILMITIVSDPLPPTLRAKARSLGLILALLLRIALLFVFVSLTGITEPLWGGLTVRNLVLILGGGFLIYKAVTEIHHTVELKRESGAHKVATTLGQAIFQIVIFDAVFSVDSVVTAIGLTDHMVVILVSVILGYGAVLAFAKPIGDFMNKTASLKILALSFLVTIGVTLCVEGFGAHVPKQYIYLPMGFGLLVELLQLRYRYNKTNFSPNS